MAHTEIVYWGFNILELIGILGIVLLIGTAGWWISTLNKGRIVYFALLLLFALWFSNWLVPGIFGASAADLLGR